MIVGSKSKTEQQTLSRRDMLKVAAPAAAGMAAGGLTSAAPAAAQQLHPAKPTRDACLGDVRADPSCVAQRHHLPETRVSAYG
jgi:hypothetical protein